VAQVANGQVTTTDGRQYTGQAVLLATAAPDLAAIEGLGRQEAPGPASAVTNLYYAAPTNPIKGPMLVLNASTHSRIKNLAVMSSVAPAYAPAGQHLVSVSITGIAPEADDALGKAVASELGRWYAGTDQWRLLRVYRIPFALPNQANVADHAEAGHWRIGEGLYRTGDFLLNGSLHASMKAGRLAAEAILASS